MFVKVEEGSYVFDSANSVEGVVKSIDYTTNTAVLTTGSPSQEYDVVSKLFNLRVIDKKSQTKYDYNKWYDQVKEFHVAFKHPVAEKPAPLTVERGTDRTVWTAEEIVAEFLQQSSNNEEEFLEAYDNFLNGLEKAKEKALKEEYNTTDTDKIVGQADALTDALYFILGSFVELGLKPNPLFDIVQKSNMSKLFTNPDGTKYAKYRESDGKILKSPEFFPPEPALKEEVLRQMNNNK